MKVVWEFRVGVYQSVVGGLLLVHKSPDRVSSTMSSFEESVYKQKLRTETLLYSKVFWLNKSETKYVYIGLSPNAYFNSVIKICSSVNTQCVRFNELEWKNFLLLISTFLNNSDHGEPISDSFKIYEVQNINKESVLKISDKTCDGEIYLGKISIKCLVSVSAIIQLYVDEMKNLKFKQYYNSLIYSVENRIQSVEDLKQVISVKRPDHQLYNIFLEFILFHSEKIENDIRARGGELSALELNTSFGKYT